MMATDLGDASRLNQADGDRPGASIDWRAIDEASQINPPFDAGVTPREAGTTDHGDAASDLAGHDGGSDHPLLDDRSATELDPARRRVPLCDLHPDRLHPPHATEQAGIEAAWHADQRPAAWIEAVNPAFTLDALRGEAGHTTNCADCARAVQLTWEGRPTAAAAISDDGLHLAGEEPQGGEHPAYTEQWAGEHAEPTTYDGIAECVEQTGGSAIVLAHGDGGHAFNALWDADRGRVIWADGQTGEVGDWPPAHLVDRMPSTSAIYFPAPRRQS